MARSDLILNLVKASSKGDKIFFRRALEALVSEERQKQHHVLADKLAEYLDSNTPLEQKPLTPNSDRINNLIFESIPQLSRNELILSRQNLSAFDEVVEEHHRVDLLRSYNLEPRNRIMLIGPPGNGKTSLTEALAHSLGYSLITVRYEGVIGSYLGETANRLRSVFDFVRTRHCVLFFDEFDTVGKERGDTNETGEIKRVVSSLLLQIDALPSHVVVVSATNHPELLDRAVWRRFQLRLTLPMPEKLQIVEWLKKFECTLGQKTGISYDELATSLLGLSFAELQDFGNDILRRRVLLLPNSNLKQIVRNQIKQSRDRNTPFE